MKPLLIADLFCGAGGSTSGAMRAVRAMGRLAEVVAVNHWDIAIATHTKNHPAARHHCVNLDAARPETIVPEGRLDLLMASPECTHHSRARGGKPVLDQMRMSAWHVQRWCSTLDVRCVLVENVAEFTSWGPLTPEGKPDPAGKGLYFEAWIQALLAMGYQVAWRLLNAADFGDATTRTRFFLQARKDGLPIRWPEASHSQSGAADMLGHRPRWRAARDVIDWERPGGSLLERKRPLSLKTRVRIARGLQRFGGVLAPLYIDLLDLPADEAAAFAGDGGPGPGGFVSTFRNNVRPRGPEEPLPTVAASTNHLSIVTPTAEPFVTVSRTNNVPRSIDGPLPTITTVPAMFMVEPSAEPFIMANRENNVPRSVDEPAATMTTAPGGGGLYLVEPAAAPFVLGQQSGSTPRETGEPIPTIAAAGAISMIEPTLVPYYRTGEARPLDAPMPTVTTHDRFGLCSPLVVPYGPRADAREVDAPLPTVMTSDRLGIAVPTAEPFLIPGFGEREGQAPRVHDVDLPLPTVTGQGHTHLVEPMVVTIDQAGGAGRYCRSVDEPMATLTTKSNQALAEPVLVKVNHGEGGGWGRAIDEPLPTVTAGQRGLAVAEPTAIPATGNVDPRRLVLIDGVPHVLDIRFRMLSNRELARAMGFDDDGEYHFTGNVGQVTRQIGNAVSVATAAALVTAILGADQRIQEAA